MFYFWVFPPIGAPIRRVGARSSSCSSTPNSRQRFWTCRGPGLRFLFSQLLIEGRDASTWIASNVCERPLSSLSSRMVFTWLPPLVKASPRSAEAARASSKPDSRSEYVPRLRHLKGIELTPRTSGPQKNGEPVVALELLSPNSPCLYLRRIGTRQARERERGSLTFNY